MVKRGDHATAPLRSRAPSTLTSSAWRSPEPWNQQTSRSPSGVSTMHEPWLCQCSSGKISSERQNGSPAAETTAAARHTRAHTSQKMGFIDEGKKAEVGFEPTNNGFAIRPL